MVRSVNMQSDSPERAPGHANQGDMREGMPCPDCQSRAAALERRNKREKRARKEAEDLLEQKSLELFEVNRRLEHLNSELEQRVLERTGELEAERARALLLAEQDHLTKLANRSVIANAMNAAAKSGQPFTLVLIDLDGFKQINDTHGHVAGDAFLCAVAERIHRTVPGNTLAARLGGDEFALLLPNAGCAQEVAAVLHPLTAALSQPFSYGNSALHCGCSIGYAYYPKHAETTADLQINADLALYKAKHNTRKDWVEFYPELADRYRERKTLAQDLRVALQCGLLATYYQPIVDFGDRRSLGCEVLLRWKHPSKGWVNPVDIVGIANESGQLHLLTRFVISNALRELAPLLRSGTLAYATINLTERDLQDGNLGTFIIDMCREQNIGPECIKFEITEHSVVTNAPAAQKTMDHLNSHGFHFAIDDFGTGYSNLQTLHQLPFRILKIDKSFVSSLFSGNDTKTIVRAMIDLAHGLRLKVVAEGIESLQQSEALRSMGCDCGQGYLFSKAIDFAAFREYLLSDAPTSHAAAPETQNQLPLSSHG